MFKELFAHRIPYLGDAIFMLVVTLLLISGLNITFIIILLILMPFLVIEKTAIITAHRFSSVADCDEILYMQDGEIIERGTFEELMALDGSFAHVYRVQQKQQASTIYSILKKDGGENHG